MSFGLAHVKVFGTAVFLSHNCPQKAIKSVGDKGRGGMWILNTLLDVSQLYFDQCIAEIRH